MNELVAGEATTPLGVMSLVVSDHGVVATAFDDEDPDAAIAGVEARLQARIRASSRRTAGVRRDVEEYFEGRSRGLRTPPDLVLVPHGFGRRVLEVTATIPFGELWSYGDVAQMAGGPRGGRAAGSALSRCPMELFVPCHRVVRAAGALGGYGRFTDRKQWLLRHEGSV